MISRQIHFPEITVFAIWGLDDTAVESRRGVKGCSPVVLLTLLCEDAAVSKVTDVYYRGQPCPSHERLTRGFLGSIPGGRWANGRVDLIKIDTEGAEGMILEGMQETIERNPGLRLVVEFFPYKLKQAGYDPPRFLDLVQSHGMQLHDVDEWEGETIAVSRSELFQRSGLSKAGLTNLFLKRNGKSRPDGDSRQ